MEFHCNANSFVSCVFEGSWAQKPKSWEWDFWSGAANGNVRHSSIAIYYWLLLRNLISRNILQLKQSHQCWKCSTGRLTVFVSILWCLGRLVFFGLRTTVKGKTFLLFVQLFIFFLCLNVIRIPAGSRLYCLGHPGQSSHWAARIVHEVWPRLNAKRCHHRWGEWPDEFDFCKSVGKCLKFLLVLWRRTKVALRFIILIWTLSKIPNERGSVV